MHSTPVLLVSLSGCIPKQVVCLRTHRKRLSFKSQETRMKRWFKAHPRVGRFESLLTSKDAKSACRKLKIRLDMKKAELAAFFMEKE